MRRLAAVLAVLAAQPVGVLLPTMADAFAARPRPVEVSVARVPLTGRVDSGALTAERAAGRPITAGVTASTTPDALSAAVAAPGPGTSATTSTGSGTGTPAATASGGRVARPVSDLRLAVLTPQRMTKRFGVAGVTWTGPTPPGTTVSIRVRENGHWGEWTPAPVSDDGPDPGSGETGNGTSGTDPLLTSGSADGVQVKVLSDTGEAPAGLDLALVDPGTSPADGVVGTTATASAQAASGRPLIHSRAEWGADESLRRGTLTYVSDLRAGVLHHTAGANNYSAASVPSQLRGIYAFHTKVRGWNDIAYNVLVDRFGRAWEGRYGGLDRNVMGAHALGFNSNTFGVSAMGNYEAVAPSSAMLSTITKVFAWKLSLNRIDPRGRTTLTSGGNLKYKAGTKVTLPTMFAHRDVGPTACPGKNLYAKMASLRERVATAVGAQILKPSVPTRAVVAGTSGMSFPVTAKLTVPQSWKVTVTSSCSPTPVWTRTGSGSSVSTAWNGKTSGGSAVPAGTYLITLTARSATSVSTPYPARVEVLPAPTSALGPCPTYRLASTGSTSVADGTRRVQGASTKLVVVPSDGTHRGEILGAGALARAYGARLMSSPAGTLSPTVVARLTRDSVGTVVLLGRNGTWTAGVASQLSGVPTRVDVGGASANAVLVETGRATAAALSTAGRPTTKALLADPANANAYAGAAAVAGRLGRIVLPASGGTVPTATATALSDLGITEVTLVGTGGLAAGAVTTLRGLVATVNDVRGSTSDDALRRLADLVPSAERTTAVLVPPTLGMEAVLSSVLGRPQLALSAGTPAPKAKAWLTANATKVHRIAVASTRSFAPATLLDRTNAYVKAASTASTAAAPPKAFVVSGAGFGHGAGMSQYGAYAMALGGSSYQKILGTYYPGTAVSTVADTRHVKVNVLHSAAKATFGVDRAPGVTGTVGLRMSVAGHSASTAAGGHSLVVVPSGASGLEVRRGTTKLFTTTSPVHVTWTGTPDLAGNAALARLTGSGTEGTKRATPYRYGEMWVVRQGSRLEVVNELQVGGEYVRGLAEMPLSWGVRGPAALRAQTVAARTYAWAKLLRGPVASCGGCHLYDSTKDQVFGGYSVMLSSYASYWRSAVAATRGKILTYKGAPAQALYYSSSGGRTQNVADVFGTAKPYLVSIADPYSLDPKSGNPNRAWTRRISQATMRSAFGLHDVVSVTVTKRTSGKAVKTVTARSAAGAVATLSGTQLRARLRLPANWVWTVKGTA